MIQSLKKHLRAYVLADVMMAITLSSVLVLLLGIFVTDTLRYTRFMSAHNTLRKEAFELVSTTLPAFIREASAIDYRHSRDDVMGLFMDKEEHHSMSISKKVHEGEAFGRIVLESQGETIPLHSDRLRVDQLLFSFAEHPSLSHQDLQEARSFQPIVFIDFIAHSAELDSLNGFFSQPRIRYQTAISLRNFSASNLRNSIL